MFGALLCCPCHTAEQYKSFFQITHLQQKDKSSSKLLLSHSRTIQIILPHYTFRLERQVIIQTAPVTQQNHTNHSSTFQLQQKDKSSSKLLLSHSRTIQIILPHYTVTTERQVIIQTAPVTQQNNTNHSSTLHSYNRKTSHHPNCSCHTAEQYKSFFHITQLQQKDKSSSKLLLSHSRTIQIILPHYTVTTERQVIIQTAPVTQQNNTNHSSTLHSYNRKTSHHPNCSCHTAEQYKSFFHITQLQQKDKSSSKLLLSHSRTIQIILPHYTVITERQVIIQTAPVTQQNHTNHSSTLHVYNRKTSHHPNCSCHTAEQYKSFFHITRLQQKDKSSSKLLLSHSRTI